MPSVQEILRATGFSDEEIAKMDTRATSAFDRVLTEAQQERQQAELEKRSNVQFYEEKIMPGLLGYDEERSALEAAKTRAEKERDFYMGAARTAGILPTDDQARDGHGRFVAGTGQTAGSPGFLSEADFMKRVDSGLGSLADVSWRYERLYGDKLPIAPSELIKAADQAGLAPADYAARKFGFAQKEQELQAKRQAEHDEQIRAAAIQETDKKWAERTGSNPEVSSARTARMGDIARAAKAGEIPNPLRMTDGERKAATRRQIAQDIQRQAEESVA